MRKEDFLLPKGMLPAFAVLGACSGAIVYLASGSAAMGSAAVLRATAAIFAGLLVFASPTALLFRSLYKRTCNFLEDFKKKSLSEWLDEINKRGCLDPLLEGEIAAAGKEGTPLSIIMADLDHFKEINDTYGQAVGDHILSIFAQTILKCVRSTDIIARYGGDEIIVVLPGTDSGTARSIAERMREEVSKVHVPPVDDVVISSIHCSVGVSTYPEHCGDGNSLLRASDIALHMAKRSGRNCTKIYCKEADKEAAEN